MPLRICLVSQSYLPFHGGITEHVWHLAGALASRGHSVTILTGAPFRPMPIGDPDPPGVTVRRVGRTVRLPSHGARACVTFGWGWRQSLKPLLKEGIDVVHLQSPLEPVLPLWALKYLPGVKVGTFHTGGDTPHWGYVHGARWLQTFAGRLDLRVAVSREARRFVSDRFPGSYEVIPNGVDLPRFAHPGAGRPRRVAYGHLPRLRALYVGRLDPRKGLLTLLEALQRYRDLAAAHRWPTLEIDLVGDGPLRRVIDRRVARERLPIRCHGAQSRDALPSFYRDADIFLAPSEHGESFGISLLEAMASHLPMIAANISGYRETLAGSGAALLFQAGSPKALCEAMATMTRIPEQQVRMGEAGFDHVQRYAWPRVAAQVERAYLSCLRTASETQAEKGGSARGRQRRARATILSASDS